jgi:hypothetical protein
MNYYIKASRRSAYAPEVLALEFLSLFVMDLNPEVLCWNPRGLNEHAKRDVVRALVDSLKVNLDCLQETKLAVIDRFIVNQCLRPSFDGFKYLQAEETRGGILLAWNSAVLTVANVPYGSYAITGEVYSTDNQVWWITVIYGPQSAVDNIFFLTELAERRSLCTGAWMIIGDFNMILRASEKNNDRLDRNTMARFREFVRNQELREVYMHGRLYTWSNEPERPTLTRIDRSLISIDWELFFLDSLL